MSAAIIKDLTENVRDEDIRSIFETGVDGEIINLQLMAIIAQELRNLNRNTSSLPNLGVTISNLK